VEVAVLSLGPAFGGSLSLLGFVELWWVWRPGNGQQERRGVGVRVSQVGVCVCVCDTRRTHLLGRNGLGSAVVCIDLESDGSGNKSVNRDQMTAGTQERTALAKHLLEVGDGQVPVALERPSVFTPRRKSRWDVFDDLCTE